MLSTSIGSRSRDSTARKPTADRAPTATATQAEMPHHSMRAYVVPPRAEAARTAPITSKCDEAFSSRVSGTHFSAMNTVTAASGGLIRKIHRQSAYSISPPPTNGPMAADRLVSPAQAPIAGARSSCTKAPWIMARLPGVSSAPPMPWSPRAAISTSGLGATPHSNDASANQVVPMTKIRRLPNRSPREPPRRIRLASESKYPLVIHCSCERLASRSLPMVRRATLTTVPSRNAIPDPSAAAAITARPEPVPIRTDAGAESTTIRKVAFCRACPIPANDRAPAGRARRQVGARPPAHPARLGRLHGPAATRVRGKVRARPRLHGQGRARGGPQRPRAHHDAARPARYRQALLRRRVAAAGDPARTDPRSAAGRARSRADRGGPRLGRRQAADPGGAGPPRSVPGRLPDALLPDRHGHRALGGPGLQQAAPRHPGDGRDRDRQHGDRPDQAPGAGPLRVLPALGTRALEPAGLVAALAGPLDETGVLRARRREQRPPEGRLRRGDGHARHRRRHRRLRQPDHARGARAAVGAEPWPHRSRLRLPRLPRGRRARSRPAPPAPPPPLTDLADRRSGSTSS